MKATITFTDKPDGDSSIDAIFDPPLGKGGSTTSRAQYLALKVMEAFHDGGIAEVDDIDGDPP